MKTAVLIPCYNEAKTIEKVVVDFKKVLPHAEVYVYDNNSQMVLMKLQKKLEQLLDMNINKVKEML